MTSSSNKIEIQTCKVHRKRNFFVIIPPGEKSNFSYRDHDQHEQKEKKPSSVVAQHEAENFPSTWKENFRYRFMRNTFFLIDIENNRKIEIQDFLAMWIGIIVAAKSAT